jgi:AcrR family transcriptional regulator
MVESKEDAILRAALSCFVDGGFHGSVVPAIARAARVGTGTIYRYFAHKEALGNAVFRRCKMSLGERLQAPTSGAHTPRQRFGELWQRLARFAREEPEALAFVELHHHQSYLDDESRVAARAASEPLERFFAEAAASGVVKRLPPQLLGAMVWGAFVGLLKAARQGHVELTAEVIAESEACCWDLVAGGRP